MAGKAGGREIPRSALSGVRVPEHGTCRVARLGASRVALPTITTQSFPSFGRESDRRIPRTVIASRLPGYGHSDFQFWVAGESRGRLGRCSRIVIITLSAVSPAGREPVEGGRLQPGVRVLLCPQAGSDGQ